MKNEIKIFLSVEDGLEDERLAIIDLIHGINRIYLKYDLYYIVESKRNDDYEQVIKECDMAFIVLCSDVMEESAMRNRILKIHESYSKCKLFLFFKEPVNPSEREELVSDFQNLLLEKAGHFCNIETASEIRLDILQILRDNLDDVRTDTTSLKPRLIGSDILFNDEIIAKVMGVSFLSEYKEFATLVKRQDSLKVRIDELNDTDKYEMARTRAQLTEVNHRMSEIGDSLLLANEAVLKSILASNNKTVQDACHLLRHGQYDGCVKILDKYFDSHYIPSALLHQISNQNMEDIVRLLLLRIESVKKHQRLQVEEKERRIVSDYELILESLDKIKYDYGKTIQIYEDYARDVREIKSLINDSIRSEEDILNEALKKCEHFMVDNPSEGGNAYARILIRVGIIKQKQKDFGAAKEMINKAIGRYDELINDDSSNNRFKRNYIIALLRMGKNYEFIAKYEIRGANVLLEFYREAEKYYNRALDISLALGDNVLASECQTYLGELFRNRNINNINMALAYHNRAYNLLKREDPYSIKLWGKCLNIGATYMDMNRDKKSINTIKKAIDKYEEALTYLESSKDKITSAEFDEYTSIIYHNLANSYRDLSNLLKDNNEEFERMVGESRRYYQKAYEIRYSLYLYKPDVYYEKTINTIKNYANLLCSAIINALAPLMGLDYKSYKFDKNDERVHSIIELNNDATFFLETAYEITSKTTDNKFNNITRVEVLTACYLLTIIEAFYKKDSSLINKKYYDEAIPLIQKEGMDAKPIETCQLIAKFIEENA